MPSLPALPNLVKCPGVVLASFGIALLQPPFLEIISAHAVRDQIKRDDPALRRKLEMDIWWDPFVVCNSFGLHHPRRDMSSEDAQLKT